MSRPWRRRSRELVYLLVLVGLGSAFFAIGTRSYTQARSALDTAVRAQLRSVADLKAREVLAWRRERLGDANVAMAQSALMPALQDLLRGRDQPDTHAAVQGWIDALRSSYGYANIVLCDRDGRQRASSGPFLASSRYYTDLTRQTLRSGPVVFHDAIPGPEVFRPHFVLAVPLTNADGSAAGAMMLTVDPRESLYSSVLQWPSATETAEVVLLGREPGSVLVLSELRRVRGAAMTHRTPTTGGDTPLGRVTAGGEVTSGDPDETGLRTVAVARRVGEASWFVLARIGEAEAYAPLGQTVIRLWTIGAMLMLLCTAAVTVMWRSQRAAVRHQHDLAVLERDALRGHYGSVMHVVNDVMLLVDADGRILEANDRATERYGYTHEELQRLTIRDLRAPDTLGDFTQTWDTVHRQGHLLFETRNRRKDGSEFPVEVSVRVLDVNGVKFTQSIIRDISDRKQAEARITRLNRLYALLSHCGQAIVHARSQAELFDRVCQTAVARGGFRVAVVGLVDPITRALDLQTRFGPAAPFVDRVMMAGPIPLGGGPAATCVREGRPIACQDIATDPRMAPWQQAAAEFGLHASIALPLRRHDRVIGVLSFYAGESQFFNDEEVTLASEVAASLSFALDSLAHQERIERVLEAMDQGYFDWNVSTGETHLSPRYHTMLGYEPGELPGAIESWLERVHPDDRAAVSQRLADLAMPGHDTVTSEYRMRSKSGQYIWVHSRGKVVEREDRGGSFRIVGTNTDITERKRLEDQFLQAQKLETVGRLAGGVAHDFNNVLTVINGYSDLLLGRLRGQDANLRNVELIRQAGERAAGLTRQLLTFSRKHPSQPSALQLNAAVREFEQMARRLLNESIELTTQLDAEADHILVDPAHLHQVLLNLVVNARDAMPSGGTLSIATSNADVDDVPGDFDAKPGPYVRLTVADTGTGIDAETQSHIFEPFFTTKEEGRGTGLGLSTVYGIVRQSGGFVRVDSAPGAGATFSVYLPHNDSDAERPAAHAAPATADGGSETILVAEDQADVRALVIETLRSHGYVVLSASNGNEALRIADAHAGPIDLLLTDVIMPGLDGRNVSERLRRARPHLRTLYMSGYTDDVLGAHGVVDADVAYVAKPFTPSRLATAVREALGAQTARPAILIVDDERDVRQLFIELLDQRYTVLVARDGIEAAAIAAQTPSLSLAIVDLFMPKREGLETIRALRAAHPGIRIVAMSGAFGGQFLSAAERMGVDATLAKPIQVDVLHAVVDRVCGAGAPPPVQ